MWCDSSTRDAVAGTGAWRFRGGGRQRLHGWRPAPEVSLIVMLRRSERLLIREADSGLSCAPRYSSRKGTRMSALRTIKKYPNRRLYDMVLKKYVTLAHVHALVVAGEPFEVVDNEFNTDVTA